jgi:hypothetical protein
MCLAPQPDFRRVLEDVLECPSSEFLGQGAVKIRESLARLVCNVMRLDDGASSGD